MASSRQTDVTLVVRARDEATKAIGAINRVLEDLAATQRDVGKSGSDTASGIAALVTKLAALDKAYSSVAGAADSGAQAFQRQLGALSENQAKLSSLEKQLDAARAAQTRLNEAQQNFVGPPTQQAVARYAAVGAEITSLQSQIKGLQRTLSSQESGFAKSASDLQDVARAEKLVGSVATFAKQETQQLAASLEKQAAAADKAAAAQQRAAALRGAIAANTDSTTGKSAADSAAVFRSNGLTGFEKQIQAEAAAIAQLRNEINPLAAIEAQLSAETAKLANWQKQGKISAQEEAAALNLLKVNAEKARNALGQTAGGKPTLFGLKPYEVQNLGYQVNDVITQLASGTSLSQTLAQQGGQLLQIFPRVGASIVAAFKNPFVLAFIASIGALVIVLKRAEDNAGRLREIMQTLAVAGNGSDYNAKNVEAASKAMEHLGISASDAVASVKAFFKGGLNEDYFARVSAVARDMALVLGVSVPEAAKQLTEALTGGVEGVKRFDDANNILTSSQRQQIITLLEQGRVLDAQNMLLGIASARFKDAADKASPLSKAVRDLGIAWNDFINYLANSKVIKLAADGLDLLATSVSSLIRKLNGAQNATEIFQQMSDKLKEIQDKQKEIANASGPFAAAIRASGENELKTLRKDYADLQEKYKKAVNSEYLASNPDPTKSQTGTMGEDPELKKQSDAALKSMGTERDLQKLQKKGSEAVENLRRRNEKFLTEAEQRRRIALAGELAATKAIGDERVKAQARADAEDAERQKIRNEQDSYDTAANSAQMQARQFLIGREGFRSKAYWDVNHYRVGYGSDTTTRADGSVQNVTANTTVTLEDAVRDLDRRIGEFQNTIKQQIGSDRFGQFSGSQQAALTSIAYNYGKLPDRILDAVRHGTNADIATAVRGLKGDNGGVNSDRREKEAKALETPNAAVNTGAADAAKEVADQQAVLNKDISDGNNKLKERTAELQKQSQLQGTALLEEQAKAAGDQAVADLERRYTDINQQRVKDKKEELVLTQQQKDETRKAAEDAARAQSIQATATAQTEEAMRRVNDLTQQQAALRERIAFLRANGDEAGANALVPQLDAVNTSLQEAIDKAIKFYQALDLSKDPLHRTKEQIDAIIVGLQNSKDQSKEWGTVLGVSGKQVADVFANSAVSAMDKFAQSVAEGKNVFTSAKEAFLSFAADFLRQIAQMILRQLALNAATAIMKAVGIGVGTAHGGAVISGSLGRSTTVSPMVFANAARYHTGGVAGLKPNEVPAVLERGEEVLTRADPRHRLNGGGAGGGGRGSLKVVNLFDPAQLLEHALSTRAGEKVILNHVRNNSGAFNAALR